MKCPKHGKADSRVLVAPHWGAWIEISKRYVK